MYEFDNRNFSINFIYFSILLQLSSSIHLYGRPSGILYSISHDSLQYGQNSYFHENYNFSLNHLHFFMRKNFSSENRRSMKSPQLSRFIHEKN